MKSPVGRVKRVGGISINSNSVTVSKQSNKAIPTYEERYCSDCSKKISKYNSGTICYACHDKRPYSERPLEYSKLTM